MLFRSLRQQELFHAENFALQKDLFGHPEKGNLYESITLAQAVSNQCAARNPFYAVPAISTSPKVTSAWCATSATPPPRSAAALACRTCHAQFPGSRPPPGQILKL